MYLLVYLFAFMLRENDFKHLHVKSAKDKSGQINKCSVAHEFIRTYS